MLYENLAPFYDRFMDFIDYETEAAYLCDFLNEEQKADGLILDIGAGSGGHMLPLLRNNLRVEGLDLSAQMITVLQQKLAENNLYTALYTDDMCRFTKEERYDAAYCFGETIHHLADEEALLRFLTCSRRSVKENGYLIFTWQEPEYFEELAKCGEFYETHGDDYLLWQTTTAEENAAYLHYTAFIAAGDDTYHRIRETHRVSVFTEKQIRNAVKNSDWRICRKLSELHFNDLLEEDPYKHYTILEKVGS